MVWVLFKLVFLCWALGQVSLHTSPLRASYLQFCVLPGHNPIGLQYLAFRGLISSVRDLRVGVSDVEHKSLTVQGKVLYFLNSSRLWIAIFFGKTVFLPLLSISMLLFVLCFRGSVHPLF